MKKHYDVSYLNKISEMLAPFKAHGYSCLNSQSGECVVDAGCGVGHDAAKLAESGAKVIGSTSDDDFLAEAKLRYGSVIEFRKCRAQDTGLPDCTVDKFRLDRVLQHIDRPEPVLLEASRVLKSGGLLQISDCDYQSLSIHVRH